VPQYAPPPTRGGPPATRSTARFPTSAIVLTREPYPAGFAGSPRQRRPRRRRRPRSSAGRTDPPRGRPGALDLLDPPRGPVGESHWYAANPRSIRRRRSRNGAPRTRRRAVARPAASQSARSTAKSGTKNEPRRRGTTGSSSARGRAREGSERRGERRAPPAGGGARGPCSETAPEYAFANASSVSATVSAKRASSATSPPAATAAGRAAASATSRVRRTTAPSARRSASGTR
jgi:hypothetical protein